MFEIFGVAAKGVLGVAQEEARGLNYEYVNTEHILFALVNVGGLGSDVLRSFGVDSRKVERLVERESVVGTVEDLPLTPNVKSAIGNAIGEARDLESSCVDTGHLLLGLLRVEEGKAAAMLVEWGLELKDVRKAVLDLLDAADGEAGDEKELDENEIAKRLLIYFLRKYCLGHMTKRDFGNIAKEIDIPLDHFLGFLRPFLQKLLDEVFGAQSPKTG